MQSHLKSHKCIKPIKFSKIKYIVVSITYSTCNCHPLALSHPITLFSTSPSPHLHRPPVAAFTRSHRPCGHPRCHPRPRHPCGRLRCCPRPRRSHALSASPAWSDSLRWDCPCCMWRSPPPPHCPEWWDSRWQGWCGGVWRSWIQRP